MLTYSVINVFGLLLTVQSLDEIYESSKEAQKQRASQVKSRIQGGELVVSTNKATTTLQIHTNFNPLYCAYCGKQCNSQKQWDEHCASEKHNFNVNSDKEHQWNHRQPPWGLPGSNYEICGRYVHFLLLGYRVAETFFLLLFWS